MKLSLATLALAAAGAAVAAAAADTSTKGLTKTAAAYVADYQDKMAYVVASEEYVQRTFDQAGKVTQERLMNGDLWLTFVGSGSRREWMAVRDVAMVDGDVVLNRQDIQAVMQQGNFESVARDLMARNARFNLGGIQRNFNEPTLALLVLEANRMSGFTFDRKNLAKDGDRVMATLGFEERDSSALIRDPQGRPVHIKGDFDLDVDTGEIKRSRIEFKSVGGGGQLTTLYKKEAKLDLWVPATFSERYTRKTATDFDRIECEATYTNYRQYGAKMKMKIIK